MYLYTPKSLTCGWRRQFLIPSHDADILQSPGRIKGFHFCVGAAQNPSFPVLFSEVEDRIHVGVLLMVGDRQYGITRAARDVNTLIFLSDTFKVLSIWNYGTFLDPTMTYLTRHTISSLFILYDVFSRDLTMAAVRFRVLWRNWNIWKKAWRLSEPLISNPSSTQKSCRYTRFLLIDNDDGRNRCS